MSHTTQMLELATIIADNTAIVDNYLRENQLPTPSFEINAPINPMKLIRIEEKSVSIAYLTLLSATRDLHQLLLGPLGILMSRHANDEMSLQGIYRFKIASQFPVGEEITFESLSERCGLNVVDTRRIVRYAMTNHIFHEPRRGVVAHTATSQLLAENESLNDHVGHVVEETFPAAARVIDALEKYGFPTAPHHSGWSLANNTSKGLYESLSTDKKERGHRLARSQAEFAATFALEPLFESYNWETLKTVVDVGGGYGSVSIGIANKFPKADLTVQDLPHVIEEARLRVPEDLKNRIKFQAYDIFEPQPIRGADAYFFRAVFHNWPDTYCLKILRNQIPAMGPNSRLLIHDAIVPDPGTLLPHLERQKRSMDLTMLTLCASRHRSIDDWKDILREADPGFDLRSTTQHPDGDGSWLLDVRWVKS